MGKHSTRKLYALFAGWTFLAVLAVVGAIAVVVIFRFDTIRNTAENEAALVTSRVLAPGLAREAGNLSEAELNSFSTAATALLSDQIRTIRLWDAEGQLLAATDAGSAVQPNLLALEQAAGGSIAATRLGTPQGDLLVSYAALAEGVVLEIRQDYGSISSSVVSNQQALLVLAAGGVIALALILPVVLWLATRRLKGEYDRLRYLYHTGQAIRSTLDLTDVLEHVARDAGVFAGAPLALATLVEDETDDLILKASFERARNASTQHHRKVEEWFLRRCAGTGETIAAKLDQFPDTSLLGFELQLPKPFYILCVPILGRDRAIGIVTVVRDGTQGRFKASTVQMIEEMAGQAAMAVEQSVLFAKMRSYATEVELSYDNTLKALMAALDTKDAATHGHSERVSRLTVTLAKEMGVPKERLVDIERGALLHDVGKIGVPDAVLQKPDSLNEKEFEAMQKHPLLAGLMVSNVGFLEGAMPILLYHHERYDGTGYPFGLEGEAIPLEARIFAVVDAYDAMTSDRPYRKAMPPEDALAEIKRNSRSQFDPHVVEAFTNVIDRLQPAEHRAA